MRYYSMSRDEENHRQVDPYHLTVFDGGFYLVGYCHLRKTDRIFAVERIRELKMLATSFEVRSGFNGRAGPRGAPHGVSGGVGGDAEGLRSRRAQEVAAPEERTPRNTSSTPGASSREKSFQ
jgi:hypothetical protein